MRNRTARWIVIWGWLQWLAAVPSPAHGVELGGTVNFNNYAPGGGIDAPVFDTDCATRLSGADFLAQLFAGPSAETLAPAGAPVHFRTGAAAGYFDVADSMVAIPTVTPGTMAYVQVRAWESRGYTFATFVEADLGGGKIGMSEVIAVKTGGDGTPPSLPADLTGLRSFCVAVSGRPLIQQQPAGGSLFAGESITLRVIATGAAPISYSWRLNGQAVPGANYTSLVITNLQPAQAGVYSVVVQNSVASATSSNAVVAVHPVPPGATIRFSNHLPQGGLDAPVFDTDGVTRLAGEAYAAQLYAGTNRDDLTPIGSPVPFLTGDEAGYWDTSVALGLSLSGVAPGTRVYAQVRVWEKAKGESYEQALAAAGAVGSSEVMEVITGGAGAPATRPAALAGLRSFRLGRIPVFVRQPQNLSIQLGRNVVLGADVLSPLPVTYEWRLKGATLPGKTNDVLVIAKARLSDAGDYQVVVANTLGAATSAVATVTVVYPPTGGTIDFSNYRPAAGVDARVFDPAGVSALAGDTFKAQLYAGPATNSLVSVGDAAPFGTGAEAGYWLAGTNAERVLPNVGPGQVAFVVVRVWDTAYGSTYESALMRNGSAASSKILSLVAGGYGEPPTPAAALVGLESFHLQQTPVITRAPVGGSRYVSESITLDVGVTGIGPMTYAWYYSGYPSATTNAMLVGTNASLTLTNLQLEQSGYYCVEIANEAGRTQGGCVSLVVSMPPLGATVYFSNRVPEAGVDAPVFDVDGVTPLSRWTCVAQLYAGPTREWLSPVGPAADFNDNLRLGYWQAGADAGRSIPGVNPGAKAFVQVRAWEIRSDSLAWPDYLREASYEQALRAGDAVGVSEVFEVATGGPGAASPLPTPLVGLKSFRLGRIPIIVEQPTSQVALLGQGITLEVAASSAQPTTYQWRLNGVNLPGATNATLALPNVGFADEGDYSVVVANATGLQLSAVATVQVQALVLGGTVDFGNHRPAAGILAPVFDTDGTTPLAGDAFRAQLFAGPSPDALVAVGEAVPFRDGETAGYWSAGAGSTRTLPASGPGEVAYVQARVWERAAGASFTEAVEQGGRHGSSKLLALVAGGAGAPPTPPAKMSGLESFSLRGRPVITRQPNGSGIYIGENLTLEVSAQSSEPLTYQWEFNAQPILGATNSSWTIAQAQPAQTGLYRVIVSNAAGSTSSSTAVVQVHTPPAGASVQFSNRAPAAGLNAPMLEADGVTLLAGGDLWAILYAGPAPDQLAQVGQPAPFLTGADAGYWDDTLEPWRVIPGVAPGGKAFVQLQVLWKLCRDNTPMSRWLLEHGLCQGATSEVFEVTTGGVGNPPSRPAALTGLRSLTTPFSPSVPVVRPPDTNHPPIQDPQVPVVVGQPEGGIIYPGETVELSVAAPRPAPVRYQWRLNGAAIPGATGAGLALTNVQANHAGVYSVVTDNEGGLSVSTGIVLVLKPTPAGASIRFSNRGPWPLVNGPVLGLDGRTRLQGSNYLAALYIGTEIGALAPVPGAAPFLPDAGAGYWDPGPEAARVLPGVSPGTRLFVQVRAWDARAGPSYEQALAAGGNTGSSEIFTVVAGGDKAPPAALFGLKSFRLGTGVPVITTQPVEQLVVAGENAQFTARVSSPSQVVCQWQKLIAVDRWNDIAGASASALTISNVTVNDLGMFRLAVSNALGGTVSQPARLAISPVVRLGHPDGHFEVDLGSAPNEPCLVEVSTDLVNWSVAFTLPGDKRMLSWTDPDAANSLARFYRVRYQTTGRLAPVGLLGCVTLRVPPGFSLVANPLLTDDDTVAEVLAGMPEGTFVYEFDPAAGRYLINGYEFGAWSLPAMPLGPGQGAFVLNPTANTYMVTLKGSVPQGTLARAIHRGWSIQSSPWAGAGRLDTALGCPMNHGDLVARYDPVQREFRLYLYNFGWASGEAPEVGLGEAFWIRKPAAALWPSGPR